MIKNLTIIGNSLGVILDRPILDLLKIDRDTPIEVQTDGNRLILQPLKKEERAERIRKAAKRVMENHHETLRRLAE